VKFLTAAALGKLVALHRQLRNAGGRLTLGNVRLLVYEVFRVVRLTQLLDIRPMSAKNVMIVDDDPATREAARQALEAEGYNVACAADGQEALDRLRGDELPALILLDLVMGGMDGWQFRQYQQQDPALASVPVVVLSATGDLPGSASALGAAAYRQKPIEFDQLVQAVREHC
jgi:CheY-like chemotaxis protein